MSVLDEILTWSLSLGSSWVRDALRRIVTQSEISEADIAQLAALCKKPHGLTSAKVEFEPLTVDHVPPAAQAGPVSLVALTHVSDVNALAPNETITFGKRGLTVVYGDNGTGKSGYARILKRACRARGSSEPILANALSEQPGGTPTARLTLAMADVEEAHTWRDDAPGPPHSGSLSAYSMHRPRRSMFRIRPRFGLGRWDLMCSTSSQTPACESRRASRGSARYCSRRTRRGLTLERARRPDSS